jgi:two-component system, sensor histidine kinase and response regulator
MNNAQTTRDLEAQDALRRYAMLDSPPEEVFDDLTRLAARIAGASIAFIGFADEDRVWLKSRIGIEATELPGRHELCAKTLGSEEPILRERTSGAARTTKRASRAAENSDWPFFAGIPLVSPEGHRLGLLAVADPKPTRAKPHLMESLSILAHQVVTQLELRKHLVELERSLAAERRVKEALRTSETFYEALVESLPQYIIRKDIQGRFTFANRKFCEALGLPLEGILGRTDQDFYPPHLADKYHRDDLRVMATRAAIDTVEANQSPEGGNIFVHVIKTPLLDAQGRVVGIQGIFWDVTERKKIEEQLAYERDLLRSLLENIPDRIFFKDVASRFIRCSQSMAARLGVAQASDVVGKTDFDFHLPEAAKSYYEEEQRIVLTGKPLIGKLQPGVDAEGKESWATVTKVPIHNRHGSITGIVGISRDITKLKQAETALEQARDAALEHARLKSEFLANMSHEIRTPMNAIVGMADLLLGTPLAPEQHEYVETLRDGIETLLKLINEILDFSKIEAGKLVLESIDFDLRQVVDSTAELLAEKAHRKRVELLCWFQPGVPTQLRGDPGRLRQVLTNLLSNAIKFTERGEVMIEVSADTTTPGLAQLRIEVRDTGIGIPSKSLASIFDAFIQADGSTTRKYGGTGLGLAITKQLVEVMQGTIGVQSEPGRGSCFWLSVPLAVQTAAAMLHPPFIVRSEGRRVLVADDNATARQILSRQLAQWNVAHEEAGSAAEALARLREAAQANRPFHAALLDSHMPDMDGPALARAIKSDPVLAPTRLVMLTTMECSLDLALRKELGIEACVLKPARQTRLGHALTTVLQSEAAVPETSCASASRDAMQERASSHTPRLLLAEDNPVNQRLVLKQLEKLGLTADAVTNGREVLKAVAARGDYDIVLMDCQMPGMDGYETTNRLRQAEASQPPAAYRPLYIIALTANAFESDRERGLAAGMNDYLTKPIRLEELRTALERAVHHLPLPVPASASPPSDDVLDLGVISSLKELRSEGQPDPVADLIHLYLKDATPRVEAIEALTAARRTPELKAAAHSLKGSSNNLGARRMAALLQQVETLCKVEDWSAIRDLAPRIKAEFEAVRQQLLAQLGS